MHPSESRATLLKRRNIHAARMRADHVALTQKAGVIRIVGMAPT
ncbi:hypothetical protein [Dokdonella sp.]